MIARPINQTRLYLGKAMAVFNESGSQIAGGQGRMNPDCQSAALALCLSPHAGYECFSFINYSAGCIQKLQASNGGACSAVRSLEKHRS